MSADGQAPSNVFTIDRRLLGGQADATLTLEGADDAEVFQAVGANSPFPPGELAFGSIRLSASTGTSLPFAASSGSVTFHAGAGGFFGAGIYPDPAVLLRDLSPEADISAGIALTAEAGSRFIMMRAGYNAGVSAKGAVALSPGVSVNFGGSASRDASFGIIHQFADSSGARDVVHGLVKSWMLPHQFDDVARLPARTWLVSEVDGSFALNLGVQAGYDYSWMRQFSSGAFKGDLGLKVQLAANAALGFSASGTFALVLSRETDLQTIRLRLFKLSKNGVSFAVNASAGAQLKLPPIFEGNHNIADLISAVLGVHVAQLVSDLADPKLAAIVAKFIETSGKGQVDQFLTLWTALTHEAATMLASIVQKGDGIGQLTGFLKQIQQLDPAHASTGVKSLLAKALSHGDFFQTPVGRWIEAAVPTTALAAIVGSDDWKVVKDLSGVALDILNGGTLGNLIDFAGKHLAPDVIQKVETQDQVAQMDPWLQAKVAGFLGSDSPAGLKLAEVRKVQTTLQTLLANGDRFYDAARKAVTKKYEIAFAAGYEKSTSSTALLDATFDLGAHPEILPLLQETIGGKFERLFVEAIPGVTLRSAVLTHAINRQSHADLTLPFMNFKTQDVTTVLASVSPVEDHGRVLLYDVHATDEVKKHTGFFRAASASDSKLALALSFPAGTATVFNRKPSVSYAYTLTKTTSRMDSRQLGHDLAPLVAEYMPQLFDRGNPSFPEWLAEVLPVTQPGQAVYSFEVSLPPEGFEGWFQAPLDKKDPRYFALSLGIQKRLRQMIPFYYFQEASKYNDTLAADAVLAYGALPPSNGFDPSGHKIGKPRNDVYFDLDGSLDAIVALMNTGGFTSALLSSMAAAQTQVTSGDYDDDAANTNFLRITRNALRKPNGNDSGALPQVLGPLLLFEFHLIDRIIDTGVRLAKFRRDAASKPSMAVEELAGFAERFVRTFNDQLGGNLADRALQPLGSALLLEAGRALSIDTPADTRPVGVLRLGVFPATEVLNPDEVVAGTLDWGKALVRQTLVSPNV